MSGARARTRAQAGVSASQQVHQFASVAMDTWVNLRVLSAWPRARVEPLANRAFAWFGAVERACSRFDPDSELSRLCHQTGTPVVVSPLLFEATAFALELAELTDGAFDPTVGAAMEARGFDRNYRTGEQVRSGLATGSASFRDVLLDRDARSISLRVPLLLDLGAVAKGLAIDLAAQELASCDGFNVEAGGDLYVKGRNPAGELWRIGIQHPRDPDGLIAVARVTDAAVCTSGDYERRAPKAEGHHVLDARNARSPSDVASVSVVAPTAMAADGLSTAAMILGLEEGLAFLEEQEVAGLVVTPDGSKRETRHGLGTFLNT